MSLIKEFPEDNTRWSPLPPIAIRILEALKNDNLTYRELAKIISSDPFLAKKTLQIANSYFYALPQKVNRLEKALAILGMSTLKGIALSFYFHDGGTRVEKIPIVPL